MTKEQCDAVARVLRKRAEHAGQEAYIKRKQDDAALGYKMQAQILDAIAAGFEEAARCAPGQRMI